MTSQQFIQLMRKQNNTITSQIIKDLIKAHEPIKKRTQKLYLKYLYDADIKKRRFLDEKKLNNQLPNDYVGDIIDGITGYMFGEPISYKIDKDKYSEADYKKITDALDIFKNRNDIEDLDSSTGEMMSICGYAARLLYIDIEGKERVMDIKPWEVIFIMDSTIDEVQFAMIYYEIEVSEDSKDEKRIKVEWYDRQKIAYYISNKSGEFVEDDTVSKNPQLHMFDFVPVVKFSNNNAESGDFEKVLDLINAYDRLISDNQNEIEEFRIAYLAFYGVEPTREALEAARETGAFGFPKDTDGKFITKPLDAAVDFIENHKKTLNENIYKFSKSVDMRDEEFSGSAMSGESRKWKLVGLENRAKKKERKFTKGLRYMFKVLCSAWNKKEIKLNYEDINYQYKRNLPIDLKYHADATRALKGMIDEKTRLSLLPFIPDPDETIKLMKQDAEGYVDLTDDEIE